MVKSNAPFKGLHEVKKFVEDYERLKEQGWHVPVTGAYLQDDEIRLFMGSDLKDADHVDYFGCLDDEDGIVYTLEEKTAMIIDKIARLAWRAAGHGPGPKPGQNNIKEEGNDGSCTGKQASHR